MLPNKSVLWGWMVAMVAMIASSAIVVGAGCASKYDHAREESAVKMCPMTICRCVPEGEGLWLYPTSENCEDSGPCFDGCRDDFNATGDSDALSDCYDRCNKLQEYEFDEGRRDDHDPCCGYDPANGCEKTCGGSYTCYDEDRPCEPSPSPSASPSPDPDPEPDPDPSTSPSPSP